MTADAEAHRIKGFVFYEADNGKCPASEYIHSLPKVIGVKLARSLELLPGQTIGTDTRQIKNLGGKLNELRISTKDGPFRVFFYIDSDRTAVIVHASSKKDEGRHQRNIEAARARIPK